MAILKHFSSKNADYGAAEKYLLFQHDEFTMKPVLDETGRLMLMYGKEASNRKQEIDRQHYTIPNQRPKDKHCGKI